MEHITSAVEKLKGFAKSSEKFAKDVIQRRDNSARRNPIEILKRLQREAFSDLMKLRERQDKVERLLSFYKPSRGPFQEASTRVKVEVNTVGALLLVDNTDDQSCDMLSRAGVRTGVSSRFIFETTVREKDSLLAEFVTCQNCQDYVSDVTGSPLSLEKVAYLANVNDWFSTVAIPIGAQCKDVGFASNSFNQGQNLTSFSVGPPLLNLYHDAAAALMVKRSNVAAALAQFVSGLGKSGSVGQGYSFSTFGQVICQLSERTKLTLLGLHKMPKSSSQQVNLGSLAMPVGFWKRHKNPDTPTEVPIPITSNIEDNVPARSVALILESDLDESTRFRGWIEMQKSSPGHLKWAVSLSDTPEDEVGWGLSLGGILQGPSDWDHFQMEAFLKFNSRKRFSLQPGLVYVMDGTTRIPVFMFRASCSL
ncbi:PREDICTED: uncharacterized protein LOC104604379 [Nelumbo nucifera]|uniref:Uncharacterized protein LOC104604379 n=2 Tax=Nelumbo nucifera TaxID=4432 RepID=A0A1U8Q8S0_NELNU|nr:PREDICTED: uncharacterized protein LOC104604379 [Nelumbo nucifera]XP_019054481.1 PREDICTED: uncharacterized protein LOC104604379 [Nelumbo nucifera]XP_019054482.1 PREDICTED: uncharacterized protein LOC104604379 [Nelumbo nucifera]XP_019054483.1 PREDICTED: uncharacterized protein LOC104604379 [Nelumbo nucifera]